MKNKYKIYLFLLFAYFNTSVNILANEFIFNTSEIKITDNGNIVDATNGEANSLDGSIKIVADKFNYNKSKLILNANSNATASTESVIPLVYDEKSVKFEISKKEKEAMKNEITLDVV